MKSFFLIVFFLFLSFNCTLLIAQNNAVTYFNKVYGGNDTINMLSQVVKPVDDGYLVLGNCRVPNYGLIYVSKLDSRGELLWFKSIDSINTNINEASQLGVLENRSPVIQHINNGLVLTYCKYGDIIIRKIGFDGATIWYHSYETPNYQVPRQIVSTLDGGFAVVATNIDFNQNSSLGYLLKVGYLGQFEWEKSYDMGNSVTFFSVQQWWDGTYIMGGWGWNGTDYDMWVVKTDEQGDTLWTKALGGAYNDCAASVSVLTTWEDWYYNNAPVTYLVSGCNYVDEFTKKQYVAKLSEDGNTTIWQHSYNNPNDIFWLSGLQTMPIIYPDGSFLGVAIYYNSDFPDQGFYAAVLMKFKSNGTVDWYKKLYPENTFAEAYIKDLQRTPDGGYVMAGYQYSPTPQKGWVLKMDADFNTCSFAGCDSTVYVGVGETPVLPLGDRFRISPNPAQDIVTIEIPDFTAPVLLRIFDISGREVKQVWVQNAHTTIPTQTLGTGIYICKLSDSVGSQKLVIIK